MSIKQMTSYANELERSGVGYDQGNRWSFNPLRDGKSISANGECDCSSSTAAILRAGGIDLDTQDPMYTGNFRQKASAAGMETIDVRGWSLAKILAELREGDSLLGPGHIIYAAAPDRWFSAESDERGRKTGGQTGDQTGREARFRAPYARSRGWEWILRPVFKEVVEAEPLVAPAAYSNPYVPLKEDGDWGYNTTRALQHVLKHRYNAWGMGYPLEVDGAFGAHTIRALQRVLNQKANARLAEDGVFGPATRNALQRYTDPSIGIGSFGPKSVKALQRALNNYQF